MTRLARVLIAAATAGGLLIHLAGVLGDRHWILDLGSHLRPHLVALALLLALASLIQRRWALVVANVGLLVGAVPRLAPYFRAEPTPAGERVVVWVANVNCYQGSPPQVLEMLQQSDADIVGLIEIDQRWLAALEPALARWPHRVVYPHEGTFGLGLFARWPLTGEVVGTLRTATHPPRETHLSVPTVRAQVHTPAGPLDLLLVHPKPPVSAAVAARRDADLVGFGELVRRLGPRPVLLGDLNTTPWSPHFRSLIAAGLRDARDVAGAGIQGTWPSQLPGFLRIPIDHVLVGGDLGVASVAVGEAMGSDHRPVRAVLVVP